MCFFYRAVLLSVLIPAPLLAIQPAPSQPAPSSSVLQGATILQSHKITAIKQQVAVNYVAVPEEQQKISARIRPDGLRVLAVPMFTTVDNSLSLRLDVIAEPGLRCSQRGCAGVVRVGLSDSARSNERIQLPAPVLIQAYGLERIEPDTFSISATHLLHELRVRAVGQQPVLRVRPVGLATVDIPLPVQKVALHMSIASPTIDMLGLETTSLNIAPLEGLDADESVEIQLVGKGAIVKPSVVQLTNSRGASVSVRSRSRASAEISALTPTYITSTPVTITMTFPWLFLLFTVLGGLTGGFFRQTFFGTEATRSQKAGRITGSALMAVAITVLLVLGFNVVGMPLPTGDASEPAGFAVGAVTAAIVDALAGAWRKTPITAEDAKPREHQPA